MAKKTNPHVGQDAGEYIRRRMARDPELEKRVEEEVRRLEIAHPGDGASRAEAVEVDGADGAGGDQAAGDRSSRKWARRAPD